MCVCVLTSRPAVEWLLERPEQRFSLDDGSKRAWVKGLGREWHNEKPAMRRFPYSSRIRKLKRTIWELLWITKVSDRRCVVEPWIYHKNMCEKSKLDERYKVDLYPQMPLEPNCFSIPYLHPYSAIYVIVINSKIEILYDLNTLVLGDEIFALSYSYEV